MDEFFLLALLAGFYFIGVPIWLIVLTNKTNKLHRYIEYLAQGKKTPAQAPAPTPTPQAIQQPTPQKVATPQAVKKVSKPRKSFEEQVGGHLFQWLGIGALVLGLLFFLKWSFDNGIIGETGRTVIGFVLSGCAIIAGDKLRKKYGIWALAFTGGGALGVYIVTWIAVHKYGLFAPSIGFFIYVFTTILVCLLAGHYRAISLAAYGIVGGLVIPLISGTEGSFTQLLLYVLILDIGVLALAHVRQWRVLNALTFIGTAGYELYVLNRWDWTMRWNASQLSTSDLAFRDQAFLFIAAFGAVYLLVPAVYNLWRGMKSEPADILILVGNGLVHFGLVYMWLDTTPAVREMYDAPISLGFAVLFLLFSMGIYSKNKNDTPLVLGSLSLTVLFATLAIPLQLGDVWIPFAWSVEAAFLLWMSLKLRDHRIQFFAWPVMIAAYFWYLAVPGEAGHTAFLTEGFYLYLFWILILVGVAHAAFKVEDRKEFPLLHFALLGGGFLTVTLFMNMFDLRTSELSGWQRLVEAVGLIGGGYIVLWEARKHWDRLSPQEKKGFGVLGIGIQIITLLYLTREFVQAIDDKRIFENVRQPRQVKEVGISILWAIYGSITLFVGMVRNWQKIRLFSIILLLITLGKFALIDLSHLGTGARVIGFTILGALLVAASFLYQHNKEKVKGFIASDSDK